MYMQGGTIDSCDSNGGGGAIWNLGKLEMTGGTLKFSGTETEQHNAGIPLYNAVSYTHRERCSRTSQTTSMR